MAKQSLSAALLMSWVSTPLWAQPTSVMVEPGKTALVGVYGTINKDCTSGPLPIIRVTEPPQNGRLVVIKAKVRISGGGVCPITEVPGLVARYQSRPDFSGADKVTIEIKRPDVEAISTQTIILNVKPANQPTNVNRPPAPQMPNVNPPAAPKTLDVNPTAAPNVPNDNTATESPTRPNDVDAAEDIPH